MTVTSGRYCEMIDRFLRPKVADLLRQHEEEDLWFQQDGATSHTSRRSVDTLESLFPGHLVSLRVGVGWPPRSPDLSPCDFFLWGHIKSRVYKHRPRSLQNLKAAITQEINNIPIDMLRRTMENFRERLQYCLSIGGRHLSDVIFKT